MKKQLVQLDVFRNQVAEVQLTYRSNIRPSDRKQFHGAEEVYNLIRPFFDEAIEYREMAVMLLHNRANRVLGVMELSIGGTVSTTMDVRMIFQAALKANATGIILAHNHPSGNKSASQADMTVTKQIKEAGKLLEIQVTDHLILTPEGFMSFANEGIL